MSGSRFKKPASSSAATALVLVIVAGWATMAGLTPVPVIAQPRTKSSAVAPACVRPVVGAVGRDEALEGDTLLAIAMRNHLAIDHLCFANDWPVAATGIYAGTAVVVPGARVLPANPPRDGIVVNLPERGLYLFSGGRFVRFFPVSIGLAKECPTPVMVGRVVEKLKNPVWYPSHGSSQHKAVPPGPDNPLGDRWIGLDRAGYGIHSTNRVVNIGLSTTRGCIRLYPDDIHALFDQVRVGTTVRIEYETAKVGCKADGTLYLVTFPDVYDRASPVGAARRALSALGLEGHWNADLENEAKRTRGLPISLELGPPVGRPAGDGTKKGEAESVSPSP